MKAYVVMEVELAGYESLRRGFGESAKPKYENGCTKPQNDIQYTTDKMTIKG